MQKTLITLCLLAGTLLAQGPGRRGFRPTAADSADATDSFADLKTAIGLTDAQVTQLQQLRKDQFTQNQATFTQIREKEKALQTALAGSSASAVELGQLMLDIKSLRAQIQGKQPEMEKAARALLNQDQLTKLATLESAQKLEPAIHEATALSLLARPAAPAGGFGFGFGPGAGMGFGARPMGMRERRSPSQGQ
jgi:hypothetical protein